MTDTEIDQELEALRPLLPMIGKIGLGAAIIPFFLSFSSSSSQTVNGQVVEASHLDYVAVPGGAIAVLAGLVALAMGVKVTTGRGKRLGLAGLVVGLGLFQLARGFGLV